MIRSTVTAERGSSGRIWVFQCREAPGAISESRRLVDAYRLMPEAIGFVTGSEVVPEQIDLTPRLPEDVRADVDKARSMVARLPEVQRATAEASRTAARELIAAGLSGADVAEVLGVSPQRVSQLVN